jgi:hypothetical protein
MDFSKGGIFGVPKDGDFQVRWASPTLAEVCQRDLLANQPLPKFSGRRVWAFQNILFFGYGFWITA